MEGMTSPDYPWNDLHHRSYYLPQATIITQSSGQYTIKAKDIISLRHIDWFWHPIPTPDAFEEGHMTSVSPTLKIDISLTPEVIENISVGESYSPSKVAEIKLIFQEFCDIFAWSYK